MARKSEADRLEAGFEAAALASFEGALALLQDPRRGQGRRYPLRSVVVSALLAVVCGADDAEAMASWSRANQDFLERFLDLPHGSPSQDVYLRVFAALDPREFRVVFMEWVALLKLRASAHGRQIAVDGKTNRGSRDPGRDQVGVHTVSAWAVEEGLVLGQIATDTKSNEITAMPELLRLLDLRNATVTIDAMGCQRVIAATVVDRGGNYLLAVKENQPALHREIRDLFEDALDSTPRPSDRSQPPKVETVEMTNGDHGRVEERKVVVCRDLSRIASRKRWKRLAFVAMVVRVRTDKRTGHSSTETSYYIGSDAEVDADDIQRIIRGHWGIENSCHWVLDMAFREDAARHRADNAAKNFTVLRHFALNLLKLEDSNKLGIANKRKAAGWSREYLMRVLTGPTS